MARVSWYHALIHGVRANGVTLFGLSKSSSYRELYEIAKAMSHQGREPASRLLQPFSLNFASLECGQAGIADVSK